MRKLNSLDFISSWSESEYSDDDTFLIIAYEIDNCSYGYCEANTYLPTIIVKLVQGLLQSLIVII